MTNWVSKWLRVGEDNDNAHCIWTVINLVNARTKLILLLCNVVVGSSDRKRKEEKRAFCAFGMPFYTQRIEEVVLFKSPLGDTLLKLH